MSTTTPPPRRATTPPCRARSRLTGWLTATLHLAVLVLYAASGLLVPGWAVAGLLLLWAVLAVVAVAVQRRWGALGALVPLVGLGAWFGVLTLGERLLDWTA